MIIKRLEITIAASYETNAGTYRGFVFLDDAEGNEQKLKLSNASISNIFKVITDNAKAQAMKNAMAIPAAMEDATHSPLLVNSSVDVKALPDDIPF